MPINSKNLFSGPPWHQLHLTKLVPWPPWHLPYPGYNCTLAPTVPGNACTLATIQNSMSACIKAQEGGCSSVNCLFSVQVHSSATSRYHDKTKGAPPSLNYHTNSVLPTLVGGGWLSSLPLTHFTIHTMLAQCCVCLSVCAKIYNYKSSAIITIAKHTAADTSLAGVGRTSSMRT